MKSSLFLILLPTLISVGVFYPVSSSRSISVESTPLKNIRRDYQLYADSLRSTLAELRSMLDSTSQKKSDTRFHKRSIQVFTRVRDCYKRIEWLHSYLDNEDAKNFNGSPLPKLDEHIPAVVVIEPQGLQTIEEIIAEKDWLIQPNEGIRLQRLVIQACNDANDIRHLLDDRTITDRQIIEAVRYNVLRIFTMGITGFDSPALGRSLTESYISWQSSHQALTYYQSFFASRDSVSTRRLFTLFKQGELYLKTHTDFDTFDRWDFIRQYANPVYETILDVHTASGIEFDREVSQRNRPVNYQARSIFQTSALNPLGYARNQFEKHTYEQIALGKMLFADPILSKSNTMSCASCHQPDKAFTDGLPKSLGSKPGTHVERNAPTLINSSLATKYFYDQRTDFLEEQIEHVVQSEIEFHTTYMEMAQKINASQDYRERFAKAFGSAESINATTISTALSAFVRSLVAMNSPIDKVLRMEKTSLSGSQYQSVKRGFNLFMGKSACATCHFPPTYSGLVPPFFTDTESEVLGVPRTPNSKEIDSDIGKAGVYKFKSSIYAHSFKTSTVRNVAVTAPYMHNGAYQTLEQVMEFYNNGGGAGVGINVPNQTLPSDKLNLTKQETRDIINFMKALTDTDIR
jgi:cytochrome c peroxidase